MSIPKGRSSFLGDLSDPEKIRLINQSGTRVRMRPAALEAGYNSCWDMNASPFDGKLYFAPTNETPAKHTRLVSYDFGKDEFKICFRAEDMILPHDRHMPHSKLHTSISFIPNPEKACGYTIAATTHTTAAALGHPSWMPLSHIDHAWEGFPGSFILTYDPETDKAENLGQPAARESTYGATYDIRHNALYMIGFMRGHVYRYSFDDKTVKDLGKTAEIFNYRLHRGPDGHIYSMTKSGFLYRINVDTQELENLGWELPRYHDNVTNNTWYRYMSQACDVSDHEFVFTATASEEMFLFDCDTLQVKSLGKRAPFDYPTDYYPEPLYLDEIAVDSQGVLWYALHGKMPMEMPAEHFVRYPALQYLIRWDFRGGGGPEFMGVIGTEEYNTPTAYCFCCDTVHDILYMIGAGFKKRDAPEEDKGDLGIFMLDLREFRGHMYEKGPKLDVTPTPFTEEEIEKAKNYTRSYSGEEVSATNPSTLFPAGDVTPIRLWRHVPRDAVSDSKVQRLAWDENGVLWGVCGDRGKYLFKIVPNPYEVYESEAAAENDPKMMVMRDIAGRNPLRTFTENGKFCVKTPQCYAYKLEMITPWDGACANRREWLERNGLPGPVEIDESIPLPEVAGRRYLARASATIPWNKGRLAVGTRDAMFALADGGKIHAYGTCASLGPVRCLCTNAARTKLWGVAGYQESVSTIFYFDDEIGLKQLGLLTYNSPYYLDGPSAGNLLTAIALSPDEKYLAVGGADRTGSVHILKLSHETGL